MPLWSFVAVALGLVVVFAPAIHGAKPFCIYKIAVSGKNVNKWGLWEKQSPASMLGRGFAMAMCTDINNLPASNAGVALLAQ